MQTTKLLSAAIAIVLLAVSAFANDGLTVFRPGDNVWYSQMAGDSGGYSAVRWGQAGDVLTPGDFDGDGTSDAAIWRPSNGYWYINRSSDGTAMIIKWGTTTVHPTGGLPDVPVAGDFDGDGIDDPTVWRPDTGEWWVLASSTDHDPTKPQIFRWGKLGDVPVPADYDADGRTDHAIFRPMENRWYIYETATRVWRTFDFGLAGLDLLVPADYTGDGNADIAVYRSGTWYIRDYATGETEIFQFGFADSIPVPGDYDADGSADVAVYRHGIWYIYESAGPRLVILSFGLAGDVPINSLNARQSIVGVP